MCTSADLFQLHIDRSEQFFLGKRLCKEIVYIKLHRPDLILYIGFSREEDDGNFG